MRINLPPNVRVVLYVLTALGTPVFAVLTAHHILPDWGMTLWSAEVTAVGIMAGLNVTNSDK